MKKQTSTVIRTVILVLVLSSVSLMVQARDSLESLRNDLNAAVTLINALQSQNAEQQTQIDTLQEKIESRRGIYEIGDVGPAGGIVFFVYGDSGFGTHGLEAAPEDQVYFPCIPGQCPGPEDVATVEWGLCDVPNAMPSTNSNTFGLGAQFTTAILAACNNLTSAAKLAADYSLNGVDDWFLPSEDELSLLYKSKDVVGGFADAIYWGSQQYDSDHAAAIDFGIDVPCDGSADVGFSCRTEYEHKGHQNRVRAIRAF